MNTLDIMKSSNYNYLSGEVFNFNANFTQGMGKDVRTP